MTHSRPPPHPGERPSLGGERRDVLETQAAWLEQEQPAYLVAALGRPRSSEWRALALEIERYRRASGITSRVAALGGPPPTRTKEGREWQQLAGRIAKYQGVTGIGFDEFCVFPGQMHCLQEQAALSLLESRRWLGVLSPAEIQTIIRMPTLVLRRHVTFAALLLGERPRSRSVRLAPVQAEIADVRAHQAAHEGAVRQARARLRALRGRPSEEVAAPAVRLEAKLQVHEAALARLAVLQRRVDRLQLEQRQAVNQHSRSNGLHQLPVAIGLHSAYELARRDLEAVIALEHDPPAYLTRALGAVPNATRGQAPWRDGARLIERYRAQYNVDDPADALGPAPSRHVAGSVRQEIAQSINELRAEIHRGVLVRDLSSELSEIDLGPP